MSKKTWRVEFDARALKELKKLDKQAQRQIIGFLREKIATTEDPRRFGKALQAKLSGFWRYHIGDYRVVCCIEHQVITVLVLRIGHRKDVYL